MMRHEQSKDRLLVASRSCLASNLATSCEWSRPAPLATAAARSDDQC